VRFLALLGSALSAIFSRGKSRPKPNHREFYKQQREMTQEMEALAVVVKSDQH